MTHVSLSLDKVKYSEKPIKEMGCINNRIANSPVMDVELEFIAYAVGNNGQTFCPTVFRGGKRRKENYLKQQLFALDFDKGITYEEVRKRSLYFGLPIAFSYHTFSSTKELEKFRVVYMLDCEVTDIRGAEIIIAMLRTIFPESDRACSDATHIYLGGNHIIEYRDECISFNNLIVSYYSIIKSRCPSNFPRSVRGFANKHHIRLIGNNMLDMGNVANHATIINIYEGAEEESNYEILLFGDYYICINKNSFAPEKTLSLRGSGKKVRKKCRRFAEIKYAHLYCRLYKEFIEGIDIGHDGRFYILTVLLQIRDGKKLFLNTIKETGYDYEKWRKAVNNSCVDEYLHESNCERCLYCDICDHKKTLIETVLHKVKNENPNKMVIDNTRQEYISLEEGRIRLKENISKAITSPNQITLIKAQTGIGKTYAYREIVYDTYDTNKYIIALPNNMMKNEVAQDLKNMGVPDDAMLVTPSHSEGRIDKRLEEEIQLLYDRGIYDQTKPLIKEYLKENEDKLTKLQKEYLNSFLDYDERLLDDSVKIIVTTHVRLCTFDDSVIKNAIIIIDEDILVSSFFLQTRQVNVDCLNEIIKSGTTGAASFLNEIMKKDEGHVHTINNGAYEYYSLSKDQLDEMGIFENVNDLFRAASYIIEDGIITYYVPGKLPKGKCVILSATLDLEMYKKYFGLSNSEIVYIEGMLVKYRGKIIQYNALPIGRSTLDEPNTWTNILMTAQQYVDVHTPVITFKKYQDKNNINGNMKPNIALGLYISKCLGSNTLKGKDIIVAGTPYMNDKNYELVGAYLAGHALDSSKFRNRINYGGYEFFHFTYKDEILQTLQCYWMKGELEQAVGRARIIQNDNTVVVFASVPCEQATYISKTYVMKDDYIGIA